LKDYFFTIFTRFFIVFSGLIVFIVSAKLYGSEGRGVIGIGTSLASIFGLAISSNLGRSFLLLSGRSEAQKRKLLPNFLAINYLLTFIAILLAVLFWYFSSAIRNHLSFSFFLTFLMLIPTYVWSINGTAIYAALNQTHKQDKVILLTRTTLVFMMVLAYVFGVSIFSFIFMYAFILVIGSIFEIYLLDTPFKSNLSVDRLFFYLGKSWVVHVDYLSFSLFPLVLMLMAATFLNTRGLGHLNFSIQIINVVFTLSVIGSIRMKTYSSAKGIIGHLASAKKLFAYTFIFSLLLIILIFSLLNSSFFEFYFPDFKGTEMSLLILSLGLPGYLSYQFLYPALIEYKLINLSKNINLACNVFIICISYTILKHFELMGAYFLFGFFYFLIFIGQIYLYKKIKSLTFNVI
jgi:hypothetical protein